MAKGKAKGNRGERQAVEFMKGWSGYEFSRVPQSGGLRWQKQKHITGDIICTQNNKTCYCSIEVKNYKELNFQHLLLPEVNSDILKFWGQCEEDAIRTEKIPLLLMRRDQMKKHQFFFMMRYDDILPLINKDFSKLNNTPTFLILRAPKRSSRLVIGTTDGLRLVPYRKFNKHCRTLVKAKETHGQKTA